MSEPVDWIWYGEDADGSAVISFGRWAKHPCQLRYKLAEVQPTEHDHPDRLLKLFEDHYWDSLEHNKVLVLAHVRAVLALLARASLAKEGE